MRLLELGSNRELVFTRNFIRDIPAYAILSHTWLRDEEEVTHADIISRSGTTKEGYRKILFCGQQAWDDGFRYFWVDTCCIDKTNSVELAEAINSMFKWYQNSIRCYVYLADVAGTDLASWSCSEAFRNSRWWRRGWTLQELIAPSDVRFFSVSGHYLGSKKEHVQMISVITSIPIRAIEGDVDGFSCEERMAWSGGRATTRLEDKAYSLLGIMGVFMPLIYGEGRERAMRRLRKEVVEHGVVIDSSNTIKNSTQPMPVGNQREVNVSDAAVLTRTCKQHGITSDEERIWAVAIAFSPNQETFAMALSDNACELRDTETWSIIHILEGHKDSVSHIAFSPDGKVLATASLDKTIRLWWTGDGTKLETLVHPGDLKSFAFLPDGSRISSTSTDGTIRNWPLGSSSGPMAPALRNADCCGPIALSPTGSYIAAACRDDSIRFWESGPNVFSPWKKRGVLPGHQTPVRILRYSCRHMLASASSFSIRLAKPFIQWDAPTLDLVESNIVDIAFSADGLILAAAFKDGTIRLWDCYNGKVHQDVNHPGGLRAIAFSFDGKYLASSSREGTVKFWRVKNWLDEITTRISRG